jgi:prepilin-type N-terminal cleavage/methylation domain-containing protein
VARHGCRTTGFTLLEVLVTLALLALLTGLFVGGTTALLRERPASADEVMRQAIAQARRYAVANYREVRLAYDNKGKAFHASSVDGKRDFPVSLPEEVQIDFLTTQKDNTMLLGGELVEQGNLPYITFYPDGTCTPFRVQMRTNNGKPTVVAIDPWTCAPVLETPK